MAITKSALIADNTALRVELNSLRAIHANLCRDYDVLRTQFNNVTEVASALNAPQSIIPQE